MFKSAFRVSLVLFFGLTLAAQTQTTPSGGIAGTVVNAGNNSPIRRAIVTLSTMIGVMTLARITSNSPLSKEIPDRG